jgi:hypothetical protein
LQGFCFFRTELSAGREIEPYRWNVKAGKATGTKEKKTGFRMPKMSVRKTSQLDRQYFNKTAFRVR